MDINQKERSNTGNWHSIFRITLEGSEFQHALVVADIGMKKIRNVARKTCTERRKIRLLKDMKTRKRLEEKVI